MRGVAGDKETVERQNIIGGIFSILTQIYDGRCYLIRFSSFLENKCQ